MKRCHYCDKLIEHEQAWINMSLNYKNYVGDIDLRMHIECFQIVAGDDYLIAMRDKLAKKIQKS